MACESGVQAIVENEAPSNESCNPTSAELTAEKDMQREWRPIRGESVTKSLLNAVNRQTGRTSPYSMS